MINVLGKWKIETNIEAFELPLGGCGTNDVNLEMAEEHLLVMTEHLYNTITFQFSANSNPLMKTDLAFLFVFDKKWNCKMKYIKFYCLKGFYNLSV